MGNEVSSDMKVDDLQHRQQYGQKKVILQGKGTFMFKSSHSSQPTSNHINDGLLTNFILLQSLSTHVSGPPRREARDVGGEVSA